MNWTSSEIRQLRYRLGWSQAEFARRLNVNQQFVADVESGLQALSSEHRQALSHIFHQVEANAQKIQRRPLAEVVMRDRGLSQIHDHELEATFPAGIHHEVKNRGGNA